MPDFLDRFGDQLYAAQAAPETVVSTGVGARWRALTARRGLFGLGAALVIAAPAAALVSAWDPDLERPGVDRPVKTDVTPVSADATRVLAPLRRDQTANDRATAAPLLKAIGMGNQVDRVQTEGIRTVAPGWALVPAKVAVTGPGGATGADQLCLTNGQDVGCSPAANVAGNGIGLLSASASKTTITGMAPDGVSRVRFTSEDGRVTEIAVTANFFDLTINEARRGPSVPAPDGYDGPATIPGPPLPAAGRLAWLNEAGKVVGPASPDFR